MPVLNFAAPFKCLASNCVAASVYKLNLTDQISNIENCQYLLAYRSRDLFSPGIKCHDVSSFTCLTCTPVFFVPIIGLLLTHLTVRLPLFFYNTHIHTSCHSVISVCSPRTSTVSVYVSTYSIILVLKVIVCSCNKSMCFVAMCSDNSAHGLGRMKEIY